MDHLSLKIQNALDGSFLETYAVAHAAVAQHGGGAATDCRKHRIGSTWPNHLHLRHHMSSVRHAYHDDHGGSDAVLETCCDGGVLRQETDDLFCC